MENVIVEKIRQCLAFSDGLYEGDEYFIDEELLIHVPDNNMKASSQIIREINSSGMFEQKLVRITKKGDSIILGFDSIAESESVYTTYIGPEAEVEIEVKKDPSGSKFYIYNNGKRSSKTFDKLTKAKRYITALDKQLDDQEAVAASKD